MKTCPKCEERMYYTSEHYPTSTPQRFYACVNKHMTIVRGQQDIDVDWGDRSVSNAWREAIKNRTSNDYEMVN